MADGGPQCSGTAISQRAVTGSTDADEQDEFGAQAHSKSFRPGRGRDSLGSAPPALSGDCGTPVPQLEAQKCRLFGRSIPIPR